MSRSILIIAAASLFATGTLAQQRPLSTTMSCGQVSRLIATRGAVVLSTGQYAYDRFVRSQAYCQPTEFTRPAWVPTAETPQCFIGYTCVDQPPNVGRLSPPGRKDIGPGSVGVTFAAHPKFVWRNWFLPGSRSENLED